MENDSVELIDYLRVIWKRKVLIVLGTLVCTVAIGAVSFIPPLKYKVYSVIEIGRIDLGNVITAIEKPINTKTKIERVYSYKIMQELKIPEEEFPRLKIDNPKDTRIIDVI
jgi:uncharacterized protein involved in exopolysaccharide biosynthesis